MGVFQRIWEVYKEAGCEVTLHKSVVAHLGGGASGGGGSGSGSGGGDEADMTARDLFVADLEAYVSEAEMLLLMLSVGLGGVHVDAQASFLGLLLREEVLQRQVVDLLLEKLSEYAEGDDGAGHSNGEGMGVGNGDVAVGMRQTMERNIPKLVLREIRWIDHVVDARELVDKLISSLPAFPLALQRDIIYILPEIASDEDAHIVIDSLLELIRAEADLVVCCIEALGNFSVETEQTAEIVACVVERLDSSPLMDLPAIVKYLVQEAPGAKVDVLASELREKLSTTLCFTEGSVLAETSHASRGNDRNEETLILSAIVQSFYFREEILKAFVSLITKCEPLQPLRLLDLWVLLAGHSIPRDRNKIEKLIKRKAANGSITPGLLVQSVYGHANALKSYFPSILSIAQMLVGQSNATCVATGQLLYELLFEEFSVVGGSDGRGNEQAAFYRGEVVSAMLGHCLSSTSDIVESGLDVFVDLVAPDISFRAQVPENVYKQSHIARRQRFQMFFPVLKQMLDATETCSSSQVRKLYGVLFAVGGPEDAELCNLLRKQAFHQDLRYRQFGIIGSVIRLNQLLTIIREVSATSPNREGFSSNEIATKFYRSVVELYESSSSNGTCVSVMLGELSRWVHSVEIDTYSDIVINIISEYYMEILSSRFMDDYDPSKHKNGEYQKPALGGATKIDLWMSLDDRQCTVLLKVFDLAQSPNIADQDSLLYLSSLVEVVLVCAKKNNRVEEIDSVLVCPIQLVEHSVLEDLGGLDHDAQLKVGTALWHAVNWIRTIINFFSAEPKPYYYLKVVERLRNLVTLESILLGNVVENCPSFSPPGVIFTPGSMNLSGKSSRPGKKKSGRPSKGSPPVDRAALVRETFEPLKSDVLKILSFNSLWDAVTTNLPIDTMGFEPSQDNANSASELVEFLLTLLGKECEAKAATKRAIGHTSSSHNCEAQDAPNNSIILQSCCRYAQHYLKIYKEDSEQDTQDSDDRAGTARGMIVAYLKIGLKVLDFDFDGNEAAMEQAVYRCQDYYLPKDQHIRVIEAETDTRGPVLESCFQSVLEFGCIVDSDISLACAMLHSLLSILSLMRGYPIDRLLLEEKQISFQAHKNQHSNDRVAREMGYKIHELSFQYLQHDWSSGNKKFIYKNADLDTLLKGYLHHGGVVLDNVQMLALEGLLDLVDQGGVRVERFPTLNKKTVGVYHRVMFDTLVAVTTRLDFGVGGDTQYVKLLLNYLMQSVLLFKLLVGITKSYQKSMIIATVLKAGRKFVETIVRSMPFLQEHFLDNNETVMKLISEVQVATRRMQVLCAHGKLVKDATAAAQVPMVKKLLERFIYRGEELARAHGLMDAYSTGVLKNRRIDGTMIRKEELVAQESDNSESESEPETQARDDSNSTKDEREGHSSDAPDENEQLRTGDTASSPDHPRKRQR